MAKWRGVPYEAAWFNGVFKDGLEINQQNLATLIPAYEGFVGGPAKHKAEIVAALKEKIEAIISSSNGDENVNIDELVRELIAGNVEGDDNDCDENSSLLAAADAYAVDDQEEQDGDAHD